MWHGNCSIRKWNEKEVKMKNVNEKEFEAEVMEQKGKVLVDFSAEWCAPCKAQEPILELLSSQIEESNTNGNVVKIVQVNVDENVNLASLYQVSSIPTLILFENGKPVHRAMGFQSEEVLRRLLGVVPNMLKH